MVFDSRSSSAIRGPSQIGRGLPLLQRRLRRLNLGSARRAAPTLPFFERCSRTMARKRPAKPQLEGGALPCSRPARCALRDICDVLPRRSPAPRLSPPILAAKPPPHPFVFDSRSSSAIRGPSQNGRGLPLPQFLSFASWRELLDLRCERRQSHTFTNFGKPQIFETRKVLILSLHCMLRNERFAEIKASCPPVCLPYSGLFRLNPVIIRLDIPV
jgi:hypothetical protein